MKFIRRPEIVDAFQYGSPYPEWFKWAWITGIARDVNQTLMVNDQVVNIGDYVVMGIFNELWVVDGEVFNSYYERVEHE